MAKKRIPKPAKRTQQDRIRHERRAYRTLCSFFAGQRGRIEAALKERYGVNWTGQPAGVVRASTPDYLPMQFWANERNILLRILIPILNASANAGAGQGEAAVLEMGLGVDFSLADAALSKWVRNHADKLATQLSENTRKAVSEKIATWMQDGTDFNDLIQRIGGIVGPKRAEIVAVTETTRAFSEGKTALWKQAGYIEEREWLTAEDELVCPFCAEMNGKRARLNQPFAGGAQNPPLHVRCRCDVSPVVKGL